MNDTVEADDKQPEIPAEVDSPIKLLAHTEVSSSSQVHLLKFSLLHINMQTLFYRSSNPNQTGAR
jgi:hypothetical protein